jgi:hypothetical protein
MELDIYHINVNKKNGSYEFLSEEPKGTIKKVVFFQKIETNLYNLAFGDWNEIEQSVNDGARTNNNDFNKVLATVASAVMDFMQTHPKATLFAKGNTQSRTQLYQMGISRNLLQIRRSYYVGGYFKNHWEAFMPGRNYAAFVLKARGKW